MTIKKFQARERDQKRKKLPMTKPSHWFFVFFCFVYLFYWEKSFSLDKHESYCLMSFFLLTIHQSTERKLGIMYILFVHITSWEKLYLKHSCPKKEKTSMLKKCNQVLTENKKLPGKGMTLKLLKIIKEEAVG